MAKENNFIALDNFLRRYKKDRQWLSILCDVDYNDMEKLLSNKKTTYGMLQRLLERGGLSLTISIQGETPGPTKLQRMGFLQSNIRLHKNGPDIIYSATKNSRAPEIWWENDDIPMRELIAFEKEMGFTLLYVFKGMNDLEDTVKDGPFKEGTWKFVRPDIVKRFQRNAKELLDPLSPEERKPLLTESVRQYYTAPAVETEPVKQAEPVIEPEPAPKTQTTKPEPEKMQEKPADTPAIQQKKVTAAPEPEPVKPTASVKKKEPTAKKKVFASSGKMATRVTDKSFSTWLDSRPRATVRAYYLAIHESGMDETKWKTAVYGIDTINAVKRFNTKDDLDLMYLSLQLQKDAYDGLVEAVPTKEPSLETKAIIAYNSALCVALQCHDEIVTKLSASFRNGKMKLENPIQTNIQADTFINAIEVYHPNSISSKPILKLYGTQPETRFPKNLFSKTAHWEYESDFPPISAMHFNRWSELALLADEHYRKFGIMRSRQAIKESCTEIDNLNTIIAESQAKIRKEFTKIVAELQDAGKIENFICEIGQFMYDKPAVKEGKTTILRTDDIGEKELQADKLDILTITELASRMRDHIKKD